MIHTLIASVICEAPRYICWTIAAKSADDDQFLSDISALRSVLDLVICLAASLSLQPRVQMTINSLVTLVLYAQCSSVVRSVKCGVFSAIIVVLMFFVTARSTMPYCGVEFLM